MAKIFITLTGTKHYFGNDFLEKGMKIRLEKEPDNELLSLSGSCMVTLHMRRWYLLHRQEQSARSVKRV